MVPWQEDFMRLGYFTVMVIVSVALAALTFPAEHLSHHEDHFKLMKGLVGDRPKPNWVFGDSSSWLTKHVARVFLFFALAGFPLKGLSAWGLGWPPSSKASTKGFWGGPLRSHELPTGVSGGFPSRLLRGGHCLARDAACGEP